jgi:small subunit ribosomal protein S9
MARKKGKISVETSGKRKTAIARATVRKGQGRVRVNSQPIHIMEPTLARRKALEPVQIAEAMGRLNDVDIVVDVQAAAKWARLMQLELLLLVD